MYKGFEAWYMLLQHVPNIYLNMYLLSSSSNGHEVFRLLKSKVYDEVYVRYMIGI